ncbi:putative dihydroneopterin aldolase [Waddlia chondrophila 2032/99]|uniref:dihydroneopterin aldolase n=2 Tax=Waddlia chondrophila TaxID=71667 RepID=D6YV44_WADCW|nr:dihydroneopterin aldolase [Waddlia chondrophila]ADI38005.1 putative dihydroneopterin aldolase [Waddlia chondrophila WSU 86-1044]CCB91854.1 putative dihydroneopterin aldolase [Waddlia chondrophila 2032/99]
MQGTIGFNHLRINCIIGDLPEEREKVQEIEVSVKVACDFYACSLSDDLADTVDYVSLAAACRREAEEGRYHMLETYASRTLDKLLEEFPIDYAWIQVKKASGLPDADCSFVELSKKKKYPG